MALEQSADMPGPYEAALKQATRGAQAYESFEGRLFVRATWFSPAFAAALSTYEQERLGLPAAEGATRREAATEKAKTEARFLVALNTHDSRWSDLVTPRATLRIGMRHGDTEIAPTSIERVPDDGQANLVPFFPYVGPLTTVYWVTFPLPPDPKKLTLRLAGAPAVVDLHWEGGDAGT